MREEVNARAPTAVPSANDQHGAVLVVGLIFLALLTLIGVTAFSVATQEERMAGNTRDRLRAFEAAEAALRECERLISGPVVPSGQIWLYSEPSAGGKEKWEEETFKWDDASSHAVADLAGVAAPPRCIVQRLALTRSHSPSVRAELPQPLVYAYGVTARGVGANGNTVVLLQTRFIRD